MTFTTGVSDSISPERYSFEKPTPQESTAIADQPQTLPGDSEKRMKFEEMLLRAVSPNLKNIDREQVIKIKLDAERRSEKPFILLAELFKIKIDALKKAGVSPGELSAQMKSWAKTNAVPPTAAPFVLLMQSLDDKELTLFKGFDGDQGELKKEVCILYMCLLSQAENTPLLLFELEKETGFSLCGSEILMEGFKQLLNLNPSEFLRNITAFQEILSRLESEGKVEEIKEIVNKYISSITPNFQALPYIIKYASLEKLDAYFNDRFEKDSKSSANWWKNTYRWIELHCEAAEMIAPIHPQKAQAYLAQAEDKMKNELSVFFLHPHRAAIHQRKQDAERRIAETQAKIQQ